MITRDELAALYVRTGHLVLGRCRLILRDAAEAEDVLHEVFVRVMRYGDTVQHAEIPLSWLYRIAERCCFDRFNKRKQQGLSLDESIHSPDTDPDPDRAAEARAMLELYFARLDPRMRKLALLHYVDGLTQERIADQLGWSRRTVGKKLTQLKKWAEKLRRKGQRPGGGG